MNYQAHYDKLIERAKHRVLASGTYKENHHIVPKALGGTDESENMVALLAEEHLIAHLLLAKIHSGSKGLLHAAFRMSNCRKYTNKQYAWVRQRFSKCMYEDNPSKRKDVRETLSKAVAKSWENADERKKAFSEKFSGSNNPASKLYHITDPNGVLHVIDGTLEKFTNSNGLSINILRNWVNRGIIQRTSKKDITFFRDESKRKLMGWKIDEIKKV